MLAKGGPWRFFQKDDGPKSKYDTLLGAHHIEIGAGCFPRVKWQKRWLCYLHSVTAIIIPNRFLFVC